MVHVRSQSLIGNLTLAALLTINSFHFPFPHKISGGLDILLNLIVISHFVSFPGPSKLIKGNYPVVLINNRNLHYRHKVFQVTHESWGCTKSLRIIFFSFVLFSRREKKGKVTNCGNELWRSLLSRSLTSCALNEKQK